MALAAWCKQVMTLEIANWFKWSAAITLKSGVSIVLTTNCTLNSSICNNCNYFQYFYCIGFPPTLSPTADKQNTPPMPSLRTIYTWLETDYESKARIRYFNLMRYQCFTDAQMPTNPLSQTTRCKILVMPSPDWVKINYIFIRTVKVNCFRC